eukprot:jgi/Mesvir1/1553/Mv14533-RA.1
MAVPEAAVFVALNDFNVYESPACDRLVTQGWKGRRLLVDPTPSFDPSKDPVPSAPVLARLREDNYPGWIHPDAWACLPRDEREWPPGTAHVHGAPGGDPGAGVPGHCPTTSDIASRMPAVVGYMFAAMATPNVYLWGGTVPPDFDCSGLMQRAFAASDIWVPRDAYQQEAFVDPVALDQLQVGDLVFFGKPAPGKPDRATHVGMVVALPLAPVTSEDGGGAATAPPCLQYIHSSGADHGNNGIQVNYLSDDPANKVASHYYNLFRGGGRVTRCYVPSS